MRRLALSLLVLCGCHSTRSVTEKRTDEPAPVAPPLATVSLGRLNARESSALVLARVGDATHAFIADEDDQAIVEVDPESKAIVHATKLDSRPRDLLVLADGRLAATLPDAGVVAVFTRDTNAGLNEAARVKTGAEPLAMAVEAEGTTLHVTTGASHSLVSFNTKLEEQRRVSLGREPRAVLAHGERVYVTHAIEDYVSVIASDGAVSTTSIDNLSTCSVGSHCSSARTARHAQSLVAYGKNGILVPAAQVMPIPSPGGSKRVLCPPAFGSESRRAKKAEIGDGGYGFGNEDNGPPVTSDMAVIDAATGKKWAAALPPNMGAECILPRAAAVDERSVLVACYGSSRVMRYAVVPSDPDYRGGPFSFDPDPKKLAPWPSFPNGVVPNVSAARVDVPAGPSALAMGDKGDVFVWSHLARQLSRIRANKSETLVDLPRNATVSREWLAGRELFFTNGDSRISKDGRACANCHIDGADDGLTWKTPEGIRRTRLLRGELASGPYGWTGEHKTLKEHVETTMKNLKGKGLPEDDLANLLTYLSQMKKPQVKADDTDVTRGKQVFTQAECARCHTSGSTDRQMHDVGTGGMFMTPTLASANTRRALMHDGRYKTLDEVLTGTPNMGRGSELAADDRKALAAYIETL